MTIYERDFFSPLIRRQRKLYWGMLTGKIPATRDNQCELIKLEIVLDKFLPELRRKKIMPPDDGDRNEIFTKPFQSKHFQPSIQIGGSLS